MSAVLRLVTWLNTVGVVCRPLLPAAGAGKVTGVECCWWWRAKWCRIPLREGRCEPGGRNLRPCVRVANAAFSPVVCVTMSTYDVAIMVA